MAFTYTDRNKKVILHSWGRFRAQMYEAVEVGDLLALLGSENADALQFADQSDSQAAMAIACEAGAAGDVIWCCLAAEVKAPVSIATGGIATQAYFGASSDYLGSALYLGEDGKPSSSEGGAMSQQVGFYVARDRILLIPMHLLTGTTFTFSGNGTIGGTLAVTGITTLTALINANGGIAVDTDKFTVSAAGNAVVDGTLTQTGIATFAALPVFTVGVSIPANKTIKMAVTDHGSDDAITPGGAHTLSKGSAGAHTLAAPTAGELIMISAKTAHAHVVTTGGGITWDGTNNTATFGGAVGDSIVAIGISATLWAVVANNNVTLSSV